MKKQLINRLNKRISFASTTTKKDENGVPKTTDTVLFSCWAEIWSQSITEKTATIGTVLEDTVFFNVPEQMRKKIDSKMKIIDGQNKYSIFAIDPRPSEGIIRIVAKVVT